MVHEVGEAVVQVVDDKRETVGDTGFQPLSKLQKSISSVGGRPRLGVGIGWNRVEYDALGENFGNRGKRSDEQIGLLRRLWTERSVTYKSSITV